MGHSWCVRSDGSVFQGYSYCCTHTQSMVVTQSADTPTNTTWVTLKLLTQQPSESLAACYSRNKNLRKCDFNGMKSEWPLLVYQAWWTWVWLPGQVNKHRPHNWPCKRHLSGCLYKTRGHSSSHWLKSHVLIECSYSVVKCYILREAWNASISECFFSSSSSTAGSIE